MMMPPKQDDLAARLDPTKQRPRGFNTGKGARAPSALGEDSSSWNETPEQKQKRLADEMMGVSKPSGTGPQKPSKGTEAAREEAAVHKIREHSVSITVPPIHTWCCTGSSMLMHIAGKDTWTIVIRSAQAKQRLRGRGRPKSTVLRSGEGYGDWDAHRSHSATGDAQQGVRFLVEVFGW